MTVEHTPGLTRDDGTEVSAEHLESLREAARREVDLIMATEHDGADSPDRW